MKDKNVVIAGASRGIGRAIAERFLAEGARLVLSSEGPCPRWISEQEGEGRLKYCQVDLATVDGPRKMIESARAFFGNRMHYLIYVAGVYPEASPGERDAAELWDFTYQVKVRGSYLAALEFVRAVPDDEDGQGQEDRGIVFVSSINARQSEPDHLAYDGACAAVEGQTRSFAVQFASRGIRVNCLAPGLISTGLTASVVDDPREHAHAKRCIPLGRIGDPSDCAGTAVFLCSPDASYLTGQVITVDGGIEALQAPPAS